MLEVGQKAPPLKGKTDEGSFDLSNGTILEVR